MDKHTQTLRWTQMLQAKKKLEDHQFQVDLFPTQKECLEYLKGLLKDQVSVSVGGSMTLFETGIIDFLENNQDIHYLDRYHSDHPHEIYHAALSCDYFLTSTNAVTMTGELYNVDGNGNRVAAMIYGPEHVVVIAGSNKLVKDLQAAQDRVKTLAAPANCVRLNKDNPCTKIGYCADCQLPTRICSAAVTLQRSHVPGRIHVLLINEDLGY
ncbi:lactate utilization protein [Holdemania filiformis]|uniref:Lactate utilization protein n=2 Tax=Holdemania filiformis TaxID=61171 RepID=A0A412FNY8_9FIRM|nr:lactate utilization protein [Holdemania filiformis]RGR69877.1 lactate utilization protein [Holdemania filiformis]